MKVAPKTSSLLDEKHDSQTYMYPLLTSTMASSNVTWKLKEQETFSFHSNVESTEIITTF